MDISSLINFYAKTQTLQSITSNINSVIFALRHIGTDESFRLIFKAFLNVDILITTTEAGVIDISLKGAIKQTLLHLFHLVLQKVNDQKDTN